MTRPRTFWVKLGFLLLASLAGWLALAQVAPGPSGFAVDGVSNENHNGRPTAVVRFNRPLDTTQAFDILAHISTHEGGVVDGSWTLSRDASALEFPFLETLSNYALRIDGALRAADGSTLGSDFEWQLSTAGIPAEARFMSSGSVIPRYAHQGLPIVSTNVEAVDVEFLRVRPSDYAQFFLGYPLDYSRWPGVRRQSKRAGGDTEEEYNWKSELERVTDFTESVYQQRFTLEHPLDQRALTYLPVHRIDELQTPGVYMAVMKLPNSFPNTWHSAFFLVTDLGLHARRYGDKVWVHAASLKTGKPLAGTRISAKGDGNTALGEVLTDVQGNAWLTVAQQGDGADEDTRPRPANQASELLLLSARHDDDVAMLPFNQPAIDLSALPITGRKQERFDVFSWGSRDLYRPGETIGVHLLLRDFDGHLLGAGKSLFAELLDPEGESVQRTTLTLGEGAYAHFEYTLASAAKTGLYTLRLSSDGNAETAPFKFDIHV
jgi:alpha-2-macroglobulin